MPTVANWYHCSVKPVSRSAGRSVIAAAAYRLGARLEDHEYGELRDFTRRSGVVTSFTIAPAHAPEWATDPETLWNQAASAEKRKNSQLARECELALPASLSAADREAIVRTLARDLVDRYGVAVTAAIHEPSRHGDERNHHAHILMTTREMGEEGFGKKTRVLDAKSTGPKEVRWIREHAADLINDALDEAGIDERVSHLSFKDRGLTQEPTTHLGPAANEMERDGRASDKGDKNREAEERNRQLDEMVAEYAAIEAEINAEEERELDARYGAEDPDLSRTEDFEFIDGKWVRAGAIGPDDLTDPAADEMAKPGGMSQPSWQEQKRAARDAIAGAAPFAKQIRENGAIHHQGHGGLAWWERAIVLGQELLREARDWVEDTWRNFIERGGRERPDRDPDMDMDR
jgi:hypothetical protein